MTLILLLKTFSALLVMLFGLLTYVRNRSSSVNLAFLKLAMGIFVWIFFFALAQLANDPQNSNQLYRLGYLGIICIPPAFYEFISNFLTRSQDKNVIRLNYILAFLFWGLLVFPPFLIVGLNKYPWGYYPRANPATHPIFLFYFFGLFTYALIFLALELLKSANETDALRISRIKYVFLGSLVASFAGLDFLANYKVNFYPIGFIFMVPFPLLFAYAIIKYRLMDINLAITRSGIFIAVYSLVLGIPFALALGWRQYFIQIFNENWWVVPLATSTGLATAGPFLFLYIQTRAEARLFQEQRRYQATLRQASIGMGRIKDLNRLLNLIVHIVTRTVRLEFTVVYVYDTKSKGFVLGASRSRHLRFSPAQRIQQDSAIVDSLVEARNPVLYDEIKQRTQDYGDLKLARLEKELKELDAALIVPSFIDEKLLAIIVLGRKHTGKLYTEDDLAVFSILANQAALAIENAMFYEDMKKTHAQLFKAEKMATIGTMADGLSHQINNRLHALGFIAGDVLDTIRLKKNLPMSDEVKEMMVDIEHALTRVQDNVTQGGEIVQGLLKYTRKGEEGYSDVELDKLIDAAIEMTQFKIKKGELQILKEYGVDLSRIKGNFTQLQEVFFNLIDNAYDAMMQRKAELKEQGYQPTLRISAEEQNGHMDIYVKDNGVGIRDEDKEKLFTPFFTTKLSSKKGTGLGLYVIQKLIQDNHGGKVSYFSKAMEGTTVHIRLPVSKA